MKILLHENSLQVRGTSTSVYDYATELEKKGHKCFIGYEQNQPHNDVRTIEKFKKSFELFPYIEFKELDKQIVKNSIDIAYFQKHGFPDNKNSLEVKNCIHAVFSINAEMHGDKYAFISKWNSLDFKRKTNIDVPYVPYMIRLPEVESNYRSSLNIGKEAIVVGRYGGLDSFDISFVFNNVRNILDIRKDIYFVFCNTPSFIEHEQVIFLNSFATLEEKVKFLNTCDGFLHARSRGETFGLSILEAMYKNLPIFTFGQSYETNHLDLLNGQGYIYNNEQELHNHFKNFTKQKIEYKNTKDYLPEIVIEKFIDVFLK